MKTAAATMLIISSSCVVAAHAFAGPLEDGEAAIVRRDYAAALDILRPLAENGQADAQLHIGMFYRNGWGVSPDAAVAAQWIGKAAEGGNTRAQYIYGNLSFDGEGVKKDIETTVNWYRLSAEGGYPEGMTALAKMYSFGLGVPRDYREAYFWYSLSLVNGVKGVKDVTASRDRAMSKLSKDEIETVDRRLRSWKPRARQM